MGSFDCLSKETRPVVVLVIVVTVVTVVVVRVVVLFGRENVIIVIFGWLEFGDPRAKDGGDGFVASQNEDGIYRKHHDQHKGN